MSNRKAPPPSASRDLEKELAAAEALKFQMGEIFGEGENDTELLRDMIEGETQLLETVDGVLRQIALDEAHIDGIKAHLKTAGGRKSRLEKRVETLRTMLASALEIMGQQKFDRPLAVVTLKAKAPALLVTDEAAIPSQYWKTPDPELSKRELADAIKDHRQTVDGKLAEIKAALDAGDMHEHQAAEARERIIAAFPSIPGAELDTGGTTVQIRFS